METVSTIVCPNCGANPTNHHNCEYCGSMLIRFVDKNLELDINKYGKEAKVSIPGLEESLKSNLLIQRHPIEGNISITQVINNDNNEVFQIFPTKEAMFGINKPNPYSGEIGIVLRIPFMTRSSNNKISQEAQIRLESFRMLDCFSLFDKLSVADGDYYLLECGEDSVTASRILSNVLSSFGRANYKCATINAKKGDVVLAESGGVANKKNYYFLVVLAGIIITILYMIFG